MFVKIGNKVVNLGHIVMIAPIDVNGKTAFRLILTGNAASDYPVHMPEYKDLKALYDSAPSAQTAVKS